MKSFPCTACGLCCKKAGLVPNFPEPVNPDGSCSHLKDNKCSIYETRPLICRIDEGWHSFSDEEKKKMSLLDWYRLNSKACNDLQRAAGLDGYNVIIEEETH